MKLTSYLVKSRHGVYYLRVQKNNTDKRFSLHTKDLKLAEKYAYLYGANMNFDRNKIISFEIELNENGSLKKLKTDGTPQDNDAAQRALETALTRSVSHLPTLPTTALKRVCLCDAVKEYLEYIGKYAPKKTDKKKATAKKTVNMGGEKEFVLGTSNKNIRGTLQSVMEIIGADFDMSKFNLKALQPWADIRLESVDYSTLYRQISEVAKFSHWCSLENQKYCERFENKMEKPRGQSWKPFDATELKMIFDNLKADYNNASRFWIPVIGLYTGARIGEIAALEVKHFNRTMGFEIMTLPGTKTRGSFRTLPIHPDLIEIGLLELVEHRKSKNKTRLFDLTDSAHNGAGAQPSKDFTAYKKDLGIKDDRKVFHSFRHLITHHLIQVGCSKHANAQYTGHTAGDGVKDKIYGTPLSLENLKTETIDKMNWQKYIGWEPDLEKLKQQAAQILRPKKYKM